jgi:hypothetical protein
MDDLVEVRRRLVAGDLRALYVLWLCAAMDEYASLQVTEPPVPGGLSQCDEVFEPLLEFFGIDPLILIAASEGAPSEPERPTVSLGRTVEMLLDRTEQIRAERDAQLKKKQEATAKREAAKKERARKKRMQEMVKEPKTWLQKATKLVEARGTANYQAAAELLADLREAVGGDEGDKITHKHAAHLANKHPTLTRLKSSLRKRGLLE